MGDAGFTPDSTTWSYTQGNSTLNPPTTTVNFSGGEVHAIRTRTGLAILMIVILVIALVGNFLVLLAISKTPSLRRLNNFLLVNLAVSDFLTAIICMPLFITEMFSDYRWILPDATCAFYISIQLSFICLSITNITAISVERVFIITAPLVYQRTVTPCRMGTLICCLWICSITYGMSQLYWFRTDPYKSWAKNNPNYCRYLPPFLYGIFDFIFGFAVPLFIMFGAYLKIYLIVNSQMKRIHPRMSDYWEEESNNSSNNYEKYISQIYTDKSTDRIKNHRMKELDRISKEPVVGDQSGLNSLQSSLSSSIMDSRESGTIRTECSVHYSQFSDNDDPINDFDNIMALAADDGDDVSPYKRISASCGNLVYERDTYDIVSMIKEESTPRSKSNPSREDIESCARSRMSDCSAYMKCMNCSKNCTTKCSKIKHYSESGQEARCLCCKGVLLIQSPSYSPNNDSGFQSRPSRMIRSAGASPLHRLIQSIHSPINFPKSLEPLMCKSAEPMACNCVITTYKGKVNKQICDMCKQKEIELKEFKVPLLGKENTEGITNKSPQKEKRTSRSPKRTINKDKTASRNINNRTPRKTKDKDTDDKCDEKLIEKKSNVKLANDINKLNRTNSKIGRGLGKLGNQDTTLSNNTVALSPAQSPCKIRPRSATTNREKSPNRNLVLVPAKSPSRSIKSPAKSPGKKSQSLEQLNKKNKELTRLDDKSRSYEHVNKRNQPRTSLASTDKDELHKGKKGGNKGPTIQRYVSTESSISMGSNEVFTNNSAALYEQQYRMEKHIVEINTFINDMPTLCPENQSRMRSNSGLGHSESSIPSKIPRLNRCLSDPREGGTDVQIQVSRASSHSAGSQISHRRATSARDLTALGKSRIPILKTSSRYASTGQIADSKTPPGTRKRNSVVFKLYEDEINTDDDPDIVQTIPKLRENNVIVKNSTEITPDPVLPSDEKRRQSRRESRQRKIAASKRHTQLWAKKHFNVSRDQSNWSIKGGVGAGSVGQGSKGSKGSNFSQGSTQFSKGSNFSRGSQMSKASRWSKGSQASRWSNISRSSSVIFRIRENKAIRMTAAVIGAFIICLLPYKITFMLRISEVGSVSDLVWNIVNAIMFFSNALNPFIYNFYNSSFRAAIKRIILCRSSPPVGPV